VSAGQVAVASCPGSGARVYARADEGDYRCELAQQFTDRGVDMSTGAGASVSRELGRPYATRLQLAGTAELPRASIHLLLEALPDTARLINIYEGTRYEVQYLDDAGTRFFATNNRNMSAVFTRFRTLYPDRTSRYLMFENGEAKFLFWHFKGSAVVELGLVESEEETEFQASLHIFTDSKRFHSFFQSGIFRYIVKSVVLRIIGDMADAANHLIESDREFSTLDPSFVSRLRASAH